MITYSVVAGDLSDVFYLETGEPFRNIKIEFIGSIAGETPHQLSYDIPVHAFGGDDCSFYTLPSGTKVICRGWLEVREKMGVVLVSELEELFPTKGKHSKTASKRVENQHMD